MRGKRTFSTYVTLSELTVVARRMQENLASEAVLRRNRPLT
jgi:hypothetical protein